MKKFFALNLLTCVFMFGCKGKKPSQTNNILVPKNIINLDLSIPGNFGAIYLYSPLILCDNTIMIGSAILICEYYPDFLASPLTMIYDSAYTDQLAAQIVNACSTPGISSTTQFTDTPFVSVTCEPGTDITCTASGVYPTRSATVNGICPSL